jgi:type IV pilus assembly protein PilE
MITVAIVAIISAIAYPSYTRYITRTNRTDGKAALLKVASAQEKFYLQNNSYATTAQITTLGLGSSERGYYAITVAARGGSLTVGYTATATVVAGSRQANDIACKTMGVTDTGQRSAENSSSTDTTTECWR